MSVEQVLLFVAFVIIALFNLLRQRMRQQRPPESAEEPVRDEMERARDGSDRAPRPPRVIVPVPSPAPRTAPRGAPAPQQQQEVAPAVPRRRARLALGPRDVRRAVVLMAVLGPCRALDMPARPGAN